MTTVADEPRTATEIIARAKALAPVLRERSAEIEEAGQLPPDVVELLRATGVHRMCWRREWGGPELTSMEQTQVAEALAYGDASAAWCGIWPLNVPPAAPASWLRYRRKHSCQRGRPTKTPTTLRSTGRGKRYVPWSSAGRKIRCGSIAAFNGCRNRRPASAD